MGRANRKNYLLFWFSLYFGFLGGISGVLVDLDHILTYIGFPYTEGILAGRPFHVSMAIIAGCVAIYCCTRLRGLANKLVLKIEG